MAKKKKSTKKETKSISEEGKVKNSKKKNKKINKKDIPSLQLKSERDIAMDFAVKVYKKYDKIVKSIILFGSTIKQSQVAGSDIDLIIVIDDVTVQWDQELIAWYREELTKLIRSNPYSRDLHINTIKLSTWWEDLMRGDPTLINIIRYGETLIDFAGFFDPIKSLLIQGKIRATPESIHSCLQRAPQHIARSKSAELGSIEGLFWSMVDSAHAALIAGGIVPASPEHIPADLKETFVDPGKIKMKYVVWYRDLFNLHKQITHGEIKDLKGIEIDEWQERAEKFLEVMAKLVSEIIDNQPKERKNLR